MDIHNIGGLRRIYHWETQTSRFLVFIYRGKKNGRPKDRMLQTKRLFPKNNDVLDEDPEGFRYGMNAFLNRDARSPLAVLNRKFVFDRFMLVRCLESRKRSGNGHQRPKQAVWRFGLLYVLQPSNVPVTVQYPVKSKRAVTSVKLGLQGALEHRSARGPEDTQQGSQSDYQKRSWKGGTASRWHLEEWVADHLLTCKVGQRFDKSMEDQVYMLLERRSGTIGCGYCRLDRASK